MGPAFGVVLALGAHQVALHCFWRFDHGQQALGPVADRGIRQQASDQIQLP
jgi:hypothetical protein